MENLEIGTLSRNYQRILFFLTVFRKKGYSFSMHITQDTIRILRCLSLANLVAAIIIVPVSVFAEKHPIRHEIRAGLSWAQEHSNYAHYISNGEPNPSKSELFEKTPLSITGQYTFFFTPLLLQPDVPTMLWNFYRRPTKADLSFTFQPEAQMTNIHDDPALGYHRRTVVDEQLRTFSVSGEHYILPNTGISVQYAEFQNDDNRHTQIGNGETGSQRTGNNEGLRHQYGIGLSQYLSQNLNIRAGYERMDGEYRGRERNWKNENPDLETRYYTDSALTGNQLSCEGTWIVNTFLGLQVHYNHLNYRLKADYLPVFPKGLPGESMLYTDDLRRHAGTLQLTIYPRQNTSLWWRAIYTGESIQRTYDDIAQTVDYDRRYVQCRIGVQHDVNQRFSLQFSYGYLRRDGDVRIEEDNEAVPLATYDTERNRHTITIGFIGRF